jgi:general L-amino acid transport system permease protein
VDHPVFVVLSETQPEPKDFKVTQAMVDSGGPDTADDIYPAASMILFDTVAITNRGTNIPKPLLDRPWRIRGRRHPGQLRRFLATLAVIIGRSLYANRRCSAREGGAGGHRRAPVTWWKSLADPVPADHRAAGRDGLPSGISRPSADEKGVQGLQLPGRHPSRTFTALLIALSLYTAAFIAEIVRGRHPGDLRGQSEAAFALGLRPGRTMSLIILPQALRVIIPPLISQYLNLTKNTSLGIAVSYLDLRGTLGGITLNQTGRELECMLLMMLIYLTISLMIST